MRYQHRLPALLLSIVAIGAADLAAQVIIREKVVIKPVGPNISLRGTHSSLSIDYFNPPMFIEDYSGSPVVTLPSSLTISGQVNITGAIGGNQKATIVLNLSPYNQPEIAWKGREPIPWGGKMYEGQNPYIGSFGKGSYPDVQLWLFDPSGWGTGAREITVGNSTLTYDFLGYLNQGTLPPVQVTASATATGSFLPNVTFAGWDVMAENLTVTGLDSTVVELKPVDGDGAAFEPAEIPLSEARVTLRVDAKGDYVYLAYTEFQFDEEQQRLFTTYHSGKEITLSLQFVPFLVYDERLGTFNGSTDTVYVTVSGGGKSSTVSVILKSEALDHFEVTTTPDTVEHSATAKIKVQGKDRDNRDVEPPLGTLVNVVLGTDEIYGNLQYQGQKGKTILDIPYADAKSGKVTFVADGENPIDAGPQKVVIGVTKVRDERIAGTGSVVVKPSIEKFCQGDADWAGLDYDKYVDPVETKKQGKTIYYKIGRKGCALSLMAMVAKAGGANIEVSSLNKWMMEHEGYDDEYGSVRWGAINDLEGNSRYRSSPDYQGKGLRYKKGSKEIDLPKSQPVSLSDLNPYLEKGALIAAQVYNPTTRNAHWVLVVRKSNGEYKILDPGCYEGRNSLSGDYANQVYKFMVYHRK